MVYSFEYTVRSITGVPFRPAVITSDDQHLIVSAADKTNRDCVMVYNAQHGSLMHKISLKSSAIRVRNNKHYCNIIHSVQDKKILEMIKNNYGL